MLLEGRKWRPVAQNQLRKPVRFSRIRPKMAPAPSHLTITSPILFPSSTDYMQQFTLTDMDRQNKIIRIRITLYSPDFACIRCPSYGCKLSLRMRSMPRVMSRPRAESPWQPCPSAWIILDLPFEDNASEKPFQISSLIDLLKKSLTHHFAS